MLAEVLVLLRETLEVQTGLPYALRSVGKGLRQAAAGAPVTAMVAASEEEVTAWLQHVLSGQYAHTLAHLDGPALLLQTEASLLRAGVAPQHCAPLLESIRKRVSAT